MSPLEATISFGLATLVAVSVLIVYNDVSNGHITPGGWFAAAIVAMFVILIACATIVRALLNMADKIREAEDFQRAKTRIEGFLSAILIEALGAHPRHTFELEWSRKKFDLTRTASGRFSSPRYVSISDEVAGEARARIEILLRQELGALRFRLMRWAGIEFQLPKLSHHQMLEALSRARTAA